MVHAVLRLLVQGRALRVPFISGPASLGARWHLADGLRRAASLHGRMPARAVRIAGQSSGDGACCCCRADLDGRIERRPGQSRASTAKERTRRVAAQRIREGGRRGGLLRQREIQKLCGRHASPDTLLVLRVLIYVERAAARRRGCRIWARLARERLKVGVLVMLDVGVRRMRLH